MCRLFGHWVGLGDPPVEYTDKVVPLERLRNMDFSDMEQTYTINVRDGQQYIRCAVCAMPSFHPVDIQKLYCSHCGIFHDTPLGTKLHKFNMKMTIIWKTRNRKRG